MSLSDKYSVEPIAREETKEWLLYKHYAKRMPLIKYAFGLFDATNTLQGVCTYGYPPCESALMCCGEKYKDKSLELNRLIKNDGLEKNLQTWFVAQTFKLLPRPMVIISYADPQNGHYGYTYQALNFHYTGESCASKEYVKGNRAYSDRTYKSLLHSLNAKHDSSKTRDDNMRSLGFDVKDAGSKKKVRHIPRR